MNTTHTHRITHYPKTASGNGYGVCLCGATIRIERGTPKQGWHACDLCIHPADQKGQVIR